VLAIRVLVGIIFIPIILVITHRGGIVFALFIAAVAGFGSRELFRMVTRKGINASVPTGIIGSICICLSFHVGLSEAVLVLTGFAFAVLIERLVRQDREAYVAGVAMTLLGMVYTGWLLGFFILLRGADYLDRTASMDPDSFGRSLVYLILAVTWSYDTIAYVAGTFFGRRRIFSRISPSKTVEGTVGGLAGSIGAALIARATFAPFLSVRQAAILGVLLGVVAQAGDLTESIMKRSVDTKDSSHMIPGHGGVLDRFDSLMFTGPVTYMYLRLISMWGQL
jgi:phosphatidate cytidylyltransferase